MHMPAKKLLLVSPTMQAGSKPTVHSNAVRHVVAKCRGTHGEAFALLIPIDTGRGLQGFPVTQQPRTFAQGWRCPSTSPTTGCPQLSREFHAHTAGCAVVYCAICFVWCD